MTEKTAKQIAADAVAAQELAAKTAAALAAKEAEKAQKAADKAEKTAAAKIEKETKAAAAKAKKEADKVEREAKKLADKAAKDAEKAAKDAAKVAVKMPEQNGIRRPKDNTETGKVWGLADAISASLGQPTPIANLLKAGQDRGLNDSTIRTQYARWRAFHGITGRVSLPVAPVVPVAGDPGSEAAAS